MIVNYRWENNILCEVGTSIGGSRICVIMNHTSNNAATTPSRTTRLTKFTITLRNNGKVMLLTSWVDQ